MHIDYRKALLLAPVGLLFLAGKYLALGYLIKSLLFKISNLGPWAPVIFILAYILACLLFLPGSLLTLGAGALFGIVEGSICVSLGATLGATAAFLLSRYVARDWVAKMISKDARFAAIDRAVAGEGWKIVGLTRLSPVFPFNVLNYAFGLTRVSLRDYMFASWLGMLPGTVMYVYIGSLTGDLARLGAHHRVRTPMEWALYCLGLAATVAVTVFVTRIARAGLEKHVKPA